ncbi:MAG: hypothetical protein IIY06_03205 [Proteobacteria bacterium]|nr:hypothetical protein [Pseudomonadota bacterium]
MFSLKIQDFSDDFTPNEDPLACMPISDNFAKKGDAFNNVHQSIRNNREQRRNGCNL